MSVNYQDDCIQIFCGDVRTALERVGDQSVQTCVTSPPYWGLRDYGTAQWEGGLDDCAHLAPPTGGTVKGSKLAGTGNREGFSADGQYKQQCRKCGAQRVDQQIGLEPTPGAYVATLVAVFREVRRVLKNDGTVWLNLGDSFWGSGKGLNGDGTHSSEHRTTDKQFTNKGSLKTKRGDYLSVGKECGLKPKDLVGIPWRVAFALQADGWYLRSDIIWSKPNAMPESVTDRPTKAHEYLFLLAKSARYYYDAKAIKEPGVGADWRDGFRGEQGAYVNQSRVQNNTHKSDKQRGHGRRHAGLNDRWDSITKEEQCSGMTNKRDVWTIATQPYAEAHFATFPPKLIEPCILAGAPAGGVVLDPFHGAGTTAMVSKQLGRKYIGIELNQAYIDLSLKRIQQEVLWLGP